MAIRQNQQPFSKTIAASKARCASDHGLQLESRNPVMRLQQAELTTKRQQFEDLIGGAATELEPPSLLPDKSRYCLLISDPDGIVVESYAPEGYRLEFDKFGIAAGSLWNEGIAGTNGIDMALRTGRILTIAGDEHFHSCFHGFSCSSAPLKDAQNNLIGSVTLVGSARRQQEEIALCEQTLRLTARQFQTRLFRNFHAARMTARLSSRDAATLRHFETLVACDETGTVVAHLPLWRDNARPPGHGGLQGRHLSELTDLSINVRGPAAIAPRRKINDRATFQPGYRTPDRKHPRKGSTLDHLARQGTEMAKLISRGRKLLNNRVPVLICGESGTEPSVFGQALLEDLGLQSAISMTIDGARLEDETMLQETLAQVRFLADYPIRGITPGLTVLNVERLPQAEQMRIVDSFQREIDPVEQPDAAVRPALIMVAGRPWSQLATDGTLIPEITYLLAQAVLEMPPVRRRDRAAVLQQLLNAHQPPLTISENAQALLLAHDWPGNLQEFRAAIQEAAICGNGRNINTIDLPPRLHHQESAGTDLPADHDALSQSLLAALDSTGWNVAETARLLGKSRATVNRWIAARGLKRPE